ncbi:unnamed protein product [Lampetra fluviatilis]
MDEVDLQQEEDEDEGSCSNNSSSVGGDEVTDDEDTFHSSCGGVGSDVRVRPGGGLCPPAGRAAFTGFFGRRPEGTRFLINAAVFLVVIAPC